MLVLGLDLETTGFDTSKDKVTEVGAVLWDVEHRRPVKMLSELLNWPEGTYGHPLSDEVKRVTGIDDALLSTYGVPPISVFSSLDSMASFADYVVAHNGNSFDKPMLMNNMIRDENLELPTVLRKPWLDTRLDLPFALEPDSRKLKHLALDAGFINPFAHRALFDVLTMLRVMSQFKFDDVVAYSKIPTLVIRAMVGFENKEKAKAQKFSWEKLGDKTFPKQWVKQIKEDKFEPETAKCDFIIHVLEGSDKYPATPT